MKQTITEIFRLHDPDMWRALRPADKRAWSRPALGDHDVYRPHNTWPRRDLPLRPAAVLMPIVERREGLTVLLTKRAVALKTHSGQVAFPGGRCDPGDDHALATALREAEEEIGLTGDYVEAIGAMEDYETVTGFAVSPVVGFVSPDFCLKPDPNEVDDVFEVPLDYILDEKNHVIESRVWKGEQRYYYVFPHERYHIWGATAAMLVRFSRLLKELG